jgi:hypothetical protein
MMVNGCNPSTWKAEAGGSGIQVQPSIGYIVRTSLKKKKIILWEVKWYSIITLRISKKLKF